MSSQEAPSSHHHQMKSEGIPSNNNQPSAPPPSSRDIKLSVSLKSLFENLFAFRLLETNFKLIFFSFRNLIITSNSH